MGKVLKVESGSSPARGADGRRVFPLLSPPLVDDGVLPVLRMNLRPGLQCPTAHEQPGQRRGQPNHLKLLVFPEHSESVSHGIGLARAVMSSGIWPQTPVGCRRSDSHRDPA